MLKQFVYLMGLCIALLVASLAQAQAPAPAKAVDNDYKLGAGDSIHITVFQNPDLTLDSRVSESGTISYPLVGNVSIGGLTLGAAEQRIAKSLKDGKFVQQPQVNIALIQIRGNQVSVLGQVNRPGRFPLETFNTKVSDMLAMAGGVTPTGSDIVIVTGMRNGQPFRKEIDMPAMYAEGKQNEDVTVQGGDVVFVNRAAMFYVYGEAQRPGAYRLERGMTVQQALAQGGGPTARGMEKWLRLDRKKPDGTIERLSPNASDLIQADDVLYVRESLF